ncbi:MAG TPA: hypothetical protein VHR42_06255 [Clostridia bacterium]|nr:hypothetical protein [Clostridia bacterium]
MFQSEKKLKLTNANLNDYNFDPHPNVSGHNLIYQAHRSVPIRFSRNALKILGADQVTIPYSLTPGVTACAKYSAQSLLSCLAPDDTALRSVYSIADSGSTGAVISPSGELTVKNPGTVRIKAVLSSSKSNLSVEGVKTVTVKRENPPKRSFLDGKLPMIAAIFAIAVVAVILLVRKFKKKKRKN